VIALLVGVLAGALALEAVTGSTWAVAGIVVAGVAVAVAKSRYVGDLQKDR
jgi:hypothetical protein